jgi:hypothetical protein
MCLIKSELRVMTMVMMKKHIDILRELNSKRIAICAKKNKFMIINRHHYRENSTSQQIIMQTPNLKPVSYPHFHLLGS